MSDAQEHGWARPVDRLDVGGVPPEALNLNVVGRRVSGVVQGFGPAYKKTYRVRLAGAEVTPAQVIATWKANYSAFWPDKATLYAPLAGLEPGDVAIINANESGVRLSTGVMVIYADDESFAFATAEGHVFSGWITFSAHYADDGTTVAQIQPYIRTSDPLYEIGFRLFGNRKEDRFWGSTLERLARHFGVETTAEHESECIDRRLQWSQIGNIRQNAMIRSAVHGMTRPFRRQRGS
jgi:hypothetical protein